MIAGWQISELQINRQGMKLRGCCSCIGVKLREGATLVRRVRWLGAPEGGGRIRCNYKLCMRLGDTERLRAISRSKRDIYTVCSLILGERPTVEPLSANDMFPMSPASYLVVGIVPPAPLHLPGTDVPTSIK